MKALLVQTPCVKVCVLDPGTGYCQLGAEDWLRLRTELQSRQLRVVALDLPTSWTMVKSDDAFTARMFEALNAMMLDMLAAIARKDYDQGKDRREIPRRPRIRSATPLS